MREVVATAANISFAEANDSKAISVAEIILILSEPIYSVDHAGTVSRQRETSQMRFAASLKPLRQMIESLTEYANDMEDAEARIAFKESP